MSKYVIDSQTLTDIGDAIRTKGETTEPILVSSLAQAILDLPSSGGSGIDFCDMSTTIPMEDTNELVFEHSLDNAPTFIIIVAKNVYDVIGVFDNRIVGYIQKSTQAVTTNSSKALRYTNLTPAITPTETDITVTVSSLTYLFAGGVEYVCLAW